MTEPAQLLVRLLQLTRRAREAADAQALTFVMVNETVQVLAYRQAALWLGGPHGHVAGVSGLPQPSPNAPYTQWLARLFRAVLGRPGSDTVHAFTVQDMPGQAAEWGDWLPAHALWIPLRHGDRAPAGALLLAAETPWQAHDLALAAELAGSYAHALAALAPRRAAAARERRGRGSRRWILAAGLLVAIFPVRYSVLAPAEVVPKDPFIVRAPLDGVVERMLVQPNQPVDAGTPLFALDQTALKTRHALARKAYDTATEEYRQAAQLAVTDDKGRSDIGTRRGVMEEKRIELAYTAEQLGRVQIAAERAGVAVFSDVNDWQGRVVTLGERVLTLADPQQVELAIDLPAGERFDATPGTAVRLYPNASPLTAHDAVVTQVAYSPEAGRDGQLAYRLKAAFPDPAALPRIGLVGTARLQGGYVPLLYYALRRPLTHVRQWLGW